MLKQFVCVFVEPRINVFCMRLDVFHVSYILSMQLVCNILDSVNVVIVRNMLLYSFLPHEKKSFVHCSYAF